MPKPPDKLMPHSFEKSALCNEAIRETYTKWAKESGFKEIDKGTWKHEDGWEIRVLKNSGVLVRKLEP